LNTPTTPSGQPEQNRLLAALLPAELERCVSHELVMNHELVAGILGVRRESITEAAGNLQRRGFINSRRGHISIVNRAGLETSSCECYGVVRKELEKLPCC
jgi:DNA-binding transcriptional MocR family regulator